MMQAIARIAKHASHTLRVGVPAQLHTWGAAWLRRRAAERLKTLPPVHAAPGAPPSDAPLSDAPSIEVHMLCGHRQLDMGLWASWSVMRFLPEARLCVHCDGTLTENDRALWQRIVPGARFIGRADADVQAAALLPDYPLLHDWRHVHLMALKLVDAHLTAEAPHVLIMDSDVLCFAPPAAVRACARGVDGTCAWMRDKSYSYVDVPRVLHEALGAPLPMKVNAGFWIAPRAATSDWQMMERVLRCWRADGRCDWSHFWAEQTMVAAWLGGRAGGKPLPPEYGLTPGRTKRNQIVRHYTGNRSARPRFFTEGVPRLMRQLRHGAIA